MKIQPVGNIIQVQIDEPKAGALETTNKNTAVEYGQILAVGDEVKLKVKKGDKIFFKSWAVDIVDHNDKKFYFICPETNGILAIIK